MYCILIRQVSDVGKRFVKRADILTTLFLFTVCVLMLGDAGRDGLWYIHLKISLLMFHVSLLFVQFLKKKVAITRSFLISL